MTLWTIFRSPLFFGGDLRYNDEWTLSLITNRAVLDMHRTSRGARRVLREGNRIVWAADGPDGVRYAALFNIGEVEDEIAAPLDLLDAAKPVEAVELWTGERIGRPDSVLSARVAPHGAKLFRLEPLESLLRAT